MSDNAELVEALGGGDISRERLARLEQYAKGRKFASKCTTCGRWFVHYVFAHLVVSATLPDVLSGPREMGRCRKCLSPGPTRQHSTP